MLCNFMVNNFPKSTLVTVIGLITSYCVAWLMALVYGKLGFAIYSFTFFFIIPLGAAIAGMVAAFGYYIAARLLNYKPSDNLLASMIAASVITYLVYQYLVYSDLIYEGVHISERIGFFQYLNLLIQESGTNFYFRGRRIFNSEGLGFLGYIFETIRILGFAFGGFTVFGFLNSADYCDKCSKYFSKKENSTRYYRDPIVFEKDYLEIQGSIEAEEPNQSILYKHNSNNGNNFTKGDYLRSKLTLQDCKNCQDTILNLKVEKLNTSQSWDELDSFKLKKQESATST